MQGEFLETSSQAVQVGSLIIPAPAGLDGQSSKCATDAAFNIDQPSNPGNISVQFPVTDHGKLRIDQPFLVATSGGLSSVHTSETPTRPSLSDANGPNRLHPESTSSEQSPKMGDSVDMTTSAMATAIHNDVNSRDYLEVTQTTTAGPEGGAKKPGLSSPQAPCFGILRRQSCNYCRKRKLMCNATVCSWEVRNTPQTRNRRRCDSCPGASRDVTSRRRLDARSVSSGACGAR